MFVLLACVFQGCDCARSAVDIIKSDPRYNPALHSFDYCDITCGRLPFPPASAHVATLIFVLSALHPNDIPNALLSARRALAPGGVLLLRDYAVYDMAMMRFKKDAKIADRFYRRGDGTRSYFFERKELIQMLRNAGFLVNEDKQGANNKNNNNSVDVAVPDDSASKLDSNSNGCDNNTSAAAGAAAAAAASAAVASGGSNGRGDVEGEVVYVKRTVTNRADGIVMKRTWIHALVPVNPDWVDPEPL